MRARTAFLLLTACACGAAVLARDPATTRAQAVAPQLFVESPAPTASAQPNCARALTETPGGRASARSVVAQAVNLALPTGAPCPVAGFPGLIFEGQPASAILPVGHLTTASSATVDTQTRVGFTVRYVLAPGRATRGCALAIVIAGAVLKGPPLTLPGCAPLSEIDVSSFAPLTADLGPAPTPLPRFPERVRACGVEDLALRAVGAVTSGTARRTLFALQNRSLTPCAVRRAMPVALLGSGGRLLGVPVHWSPSPSVSGRTIAHDDVRLAPGYEASLTVTFAVPGAAGATCPAPQAIALVLAGGSFTAPAPLAIPCVDAPGAWIEQTRLHAGVPLWGD